MPINEKTKTIPPDCKRSQVTECVSERDEVRAFEGVLTFPRPVFCQPDGLGSAYGSVIGEITCELIFPIAPPGEGSLPRFLQPPTSVDDIRAETLSRRQWGYVSNSGGQAYVERALIRFDLTVPVANLQAPATDAGVDLMTPPAPSFHQDFAPFLVPWFDEFTSWAAALSGYAEDPAPTTARPHADVWEQGSRGPTTQGSGTVLGPVTLNRGETAASHAVLAHAFEQAAQGNTFPLPHRLLRDARQFMSSREGRLALINAATAAEVAVSEALKALLSAADPESKHEAIGTCSGLVDLIKLHNGIASESLTIGWKRAANQLANPRNRAVHAGEVPHTESLQQAVDTAETIVAECSPLPSLDR